MNTKESKSKLVTTGRGGQYIVLEPDFIKCELDKTSAAIDGRTLVPYGFKGHLDRHCNYSHRSGNGISGEVFDGVHQNADWQKFAFQDFVEYLLHVAEEAGAAYVLVDIQHNWHLGTFWQVEGIFQLLLPT